MESKCDTCIIGWTVISKSGEEIKCCGRTNCPDNKKENDNG